MVKNSGLTLIEKQLQKTIGFIPKVNVNHGSSLSVVMIQIPVLRATVNHDLRMPLLVIW